MTLIETLLGLAVATLTFLLLSGILWGLSHAFRLKDRRLRTALIAGLVLYLLGVGLAFAVRLIPSQIWQMVVSQAITFSMAFAAMKIFYRQKTMKSLLIALAFMGASLIVGIVIGTILAIIFPTNII
jgi:hypothetical protein